MAGAANVDSNAATPSHTAKAALVMHSDCGRHDTGWNHPEHQGRLPAIVDAIYRDTPALLDRLLQVEAVPATREQILRVHPASHIDFVREQAERAAQLGAPFAVESDTMVSGATWDAALAAAGCVTTAVSLVMKGAARAAFALARPPGHHAGADYVMGFCFFNNVAIAARALQAEHGIERVLIVDWDVHHGNGTQDIFYDDPSVYYISLHLSPHYPGTGAADERGAGAGQGTTRNVPLAHGTTTAEFRAAFTRALDEAVAEFDPQFILVSAGYDCMAGDPLGGLTLTPRDMNALTAELMAIAAARTQGRLVLVIEGGYAPRTAAAGVVDTIRALVDLPPVD
jgi:acetoin utilization deacetylase AcuC-like enzyme